MHYLLRLTVVSKIDGVFEYQTNAFQPNAKQIALKA